VLYNTVKKFVGEDPDKVQFQIKRDGEWVHFSRQKVYDRARALAWKLSSWGVGPDVNVGLYAENSPEWCIAYLGINFTGATAVPMDAQYTDRELNNLVPFAEVQTLLVSESLSANADWAALGVENILRVEGEPGEDHMMSLPDAPTDFEGKELPQDQVASLIFTSGTTGDPKCAMLTAGNYTSNARAVLEEMDLSGKDNLLCILPLHHCYAFIGTFIAPLVLGGTSTFETTLQGPAILEAMQEKDVTVMVGVPQLYVAFERRIFEKVADKSPLAQKIFKLLFNTSRFFRKNFGIRIGKYLLGSVRKPFGSKFRFFASGGAKLDKEVNQNLDDLGLMVFEGYGLTETSPIISFVPLIHPIPGSVGNPIKNVEVKIKDPDENGVGEITVRGPNVMKGYYKNPEATAAMIRDGWLHTGDLGFIDDKGMITITGRAKEVIVLASGKNIYPEEVEKEYAKSPVISELCVFGAETADGRTTGLSAIVVPDFDEIKRRDTTRVKFEVKFDIEDIGQKLPSYMRLTSFKLVTQPLPRTRLSKLKRNLVRSMSFTELEEGEEAARPELTADEKRLLDKPMSARLLGRLRRITGHDGSIVPSDSLELDLGLDSLGRMELLAILNQEFDTEVPEEEAAGMLTVGQVLERLPSGEDMGGDEFSWSSIVRMNPEPVFEKRYSLTRPIFHVLIHPIRLFFRALFITFVRFDLVGTEKLPPDSRFILAPSHQSLMDAQLFYITVPVKLLARMSFFALEEYFRFPGATALTKFFRIIPSGTEATMLSSMQYAFRSLELEGGLCVFPEGHRSPDGEIKKGKIGVGVLSCESGAPIYPARFEGGMATLSRVNKGIHQTRMKLVIGDPILPPQQDNYTEADYRAMTRRWLEAVKEIEV